MLDCQPLSRFHADSPRHRGFQFVGLRTKSHNLEISNGRAYQLLLISDPSQRKVRAFATWSAVACISELHKPTGEALSDFPAPSGTPLEH